MGNSYHPKSIFKSILTGENNRILRNCSTETDYIQTMNMLREKCSLRKFPTSVLLQPNIPYTERLLKLTGGKPHNNDAVLTIITKFQKDFNWSETLKSNWGIFSKEDQCRRHLSLTSVRVCYTNHKNLAQRLVRAKLDYTDATTTIVTYPTPKLPIKSFPARNIPCRHEQCATCPQLSNHSQYYSYQTKRHYTIKDIYSCNTTCAIYLLQCTICCKQYIGETGTTIRKRMTHHRNATNANLNRPIYSHVKSHSKDFTIFKITIIDRIMDQHSRRNKEMEYVEILRTKVPFGLNVIKKTS